MSAMKIVVEINDNDAMYINRVIELANNSDGNTHGMLGFETLTRMLLEDVALAVRRPQDNAKHAEQVSAARIKELTAALEECLEYFKDHYDVKDGDYGEPAPNKEMQLGTMIDETLHGIRF